MGSPSLTEQVLQIHRAFDEHGIGHAFGGALALAYWAEPRATIDIDINVSVEPKDVRRVFDALPEGVELGNVEHLADTIVRDSQIRLWWGPTAIDLFFPVHRFHDELAHAAVTVPFADAEIPIISGAHLTVCKAMFNRPKDWVDIEAMVRSRRTDFGLAQRWIAQLLGPDSDELTRLRSMVELPE